MAYRGLENKRDKVTGKEQSGKHGRPVPGIAQDATPSHKYSARKPTPEAKMRPMPSYSENPFELNPQLKGFSQAKPMRGGEHFPVNPLRLKRRGPVGE